MNFDFMFDWAFWIVLFALAIGVLAVAFFYPQHQQDDAIWQQYEQAQGRIVVYVKASTYEQAIKQLEKDYLQRGWYISAFDYDTEKKVFIFVLRKEEKR